MNKTVKRFSIAFCVLIFFFVALSIYYLFKSTFGPMFISLGFAFIGISILLYVKYTLPSMIVPKKVKSNVKKYNVTYTESDVQMDGVVYIENDVLVFTNRGFTKKVNINRITNISSDKNVFSLNYDNEEISFVFENGLVCKSLIEMIKK